MTQWQFLLKTTNNEIIIFLFFINMSILHHWTFCRMTSHGQKQVTKMFDATLETDICIHLYNLLLSLTLPPYLPVTVTHFAASLIGLCNLVPSMIWAQRLILESKRTRYCWCITRIFLFDSFLRCSFDVSRIEQKDALNVFTISLDSIAQTTKAK